MAPSTWCPLEDLANFINPDGDHQWVSFVFDAEGPLQCSRTTNFAAGTATFDHDSRSQNCIAVLESRSAFLVGDGEGIAADFERVGPGAATKTVLALIGLAVRPDGDPAYSILVDDNEICGVYRVATDVGSAGCVQLDAQTRLGIRREGGLVIYYAGTAGVMTPFAQQTADLSMPLNARVGAESFGPGESAVACTVTHEAFAVE